MPKFLICFHRELLLAGAIEVEAESRRAARDAFYRGDYDEVRLTIEFDLVDSEDGIVLIRDTYSEADISRSIGAPDGQKASKPPGFW